MLFRASCLIGITIVSSACADAHDVDAQPEQHDHAGSGAATLSAPVQTAGLCTRLASALCQAEQRCCNMPGRSLDACKSARQSECDQSSHLDSVAMSPLTGFDAAAADSVFNQLDVKLASCDADVLRWSTSQAGLRSLFKGSVESGESCKPAQLLEADTTQQAVALLSCLDAPQTACMPVSLLGDWTCTRKSPSGGSCLTDDNCEASAYCATDADAVFGACAQRLALGAACSGATACESFNCSAGTCRPPDAQAAFCPSS